MAGQTKSRTPAAAPTVTFLGGAGTVTGSCYWIRYDGGEILIDCGLFQGTKTLKDLNYRPFAFEPSAINAVILTHAHIDHSGLVPKLWRHGFRGPVFASAGTCDLLTYMLPDSGSIQEMDVERLNERRLRRGEEPVEPIYTQADAEQSLDCLAPKELGRWFAPAPGMRARLWNAGHVLGSCSVELELPSQGGRPVSMLFSGDLGTGTGAFHAPPAAPEGPDYVVVESTYGGRDRQELTPEERRKRLADEVRAALAAGGNLIIPVFAVERTQALLFDLRVLFDSGRLPASPVFLDSPLATRATRVFARHADSLGEAADVPTPFARPNFHMVETRDQSRQLNSIRSGAIIMAASGMCEGGRVRHHLAANLWRSESTVLLTGYQAPGTLGRLLLDGAPAVRIMGEEVRVRARIRQLDIYSGHADHAQLLAWVEGRRPIGRAVIVAHGEPQAAASLAKDIRERLTVPVLQPDLSQRLTLRHDGPVSLEGVSSVPDLAAAGARDWHNEYASLVLELGERVRHAPDEKTRRELLERIRKAL